MAILVGAPCALPVRVPINGAYPWLADFIVSFDDSVGGEAIVFAYFVVVPHKGVCLVSVVASTIDFRIETQFRGDLVAFDHDVIANNWGFHPGNFEIARRTLGRSEATCQAAARAAREARWRIGRSNVESKSQRELILVSGMGTRGRP